jgi:hypothetical protein
MCIFTTAGNGRSGQCQKAAVVPRWHPEIFNWQHYLLLLVSEAYWAEHVPHVPVCSAGLVDGDGSDAM